MHRQPVLRLLARRPIPVLRRLEPKKRGVIELVTVTGEAVTQSGTRLNVRNDDVVSEVAWTAANERGMMFSRSDSPVA
jgi:hypothetical protein